MGMNLDAGAHPGPMGNQSPHAPLLPQPTLPRVVVGWDGAPTGGRCPFSLTTALQDLRLQLRRHSSSPLFGLGPGTWAVFGWVVAALCVWFAMF